MSKHNSEFIKFKQKSYYDKLARTSNPLAEKFLCRRVYDRHFRYLKPEFWMNKNVLDAACGEARYTHYFAIKGARLVCGIDISIDYIRYGLKDKKVTVFNEQIEINPYQDNIKFFQGDIENLNMFNASSFDTVFIFLALHHLPNKEHFIKEVHRILRPGGYFVIVEPNGSNPLRSLANLIGKRVGYITEEESAMRPKQIRQLIEANNFQIIATYNMNLFSELNCLFSWILMKKSLFLANLFLFLNYVLIPIDALMEYTIFKFISQISWRTMIIAKCV